MTGRPLDEPLRKVTLDLFIKDHEALKRFYGSGQIASVIRRLIRRHLVTLDEEQFTNEDTY